VSDTSVGIDKEILVTIAHAFGNIERSTEWRDYPGSGDELPERIAKLNRPLLILAASKLTLVHQSMMLTT
jgi:hypothetical protein